LNNYKIIIQYDGSNYAGWQEQENANTVQETIKNSINTILREEVNLIGSGRTDAGVHALGQVANFKTKQEVDIYKFQHSLNSVLPDDISVRETDKAEESFHSRFDAKKRSYLYFISRNKSPFFYPYSFQYKGKIEIDLLNKFSASFIGEKDFTSFSKKNSETKNKSCIVYQAHWREKNDLFIFSIQANRFLHGMVRTITGTLLRAMGKDLGEDYIDEIFSKKDREAAAEAVPAKGLFLYKVSY
jgi:tRNA pseudouridine38-40 synthase